MTYQIFTKSRKMFILDEMQAAYLFPAGKFEPTPIVTEAMLQSFDEMNCIESVRKAIYTNILQESQNTQLYISVYHEQCMLDMRLIELGFAIAVAINRGISIENVFNLISAHSILRGCEHHFTEDSFEELLNAINTDSDAKNLLENKIIKANESCFSQN